MKYQILFSRENKKKKSKCHLLKFLQSMRSVNGRQASSNAGHEFTVNILTCWSIYGKYVIFQKQLSSQNEVLMLG